MSDQETDGPADRARDRSQLDAHLIDAHRSGDLVRLVDLYSLAAERSETEGDIDAACFYLTHAYVFALQSDDPRAEDLRAILKARGREE